MAKKGKGGSQKVKNTSSGLRRKRRANKEMRRLEMKKRRWERYAKEIESGKKSGPKERWDTTKLSKRISQLLEIAARGAKVRV